MHNCSDDDDADVLAIRDNKIVDVKVWIKDVIEEDEDLSWVRWRLMSEGWVDVNDKKWSK